MHTTKIVPSVCVGGGFNKISFMYAIRDSANRKSLGLIIFVPLIFVLTEVSNGHLYNTNMIKIHVKIVFTSIIDYGFPVTAHR